MVAKCAHRLLSGVGLGLWYMTLFYWVHVEFRLRTEASGPHDLLRYLHLPRSSARTPRTLRFLAPAPGAPSPTPAFFVPLPQHPLLNRIPSSPFRSSIAPTKKESPLAETGRRRPRLLLWPRSRAGPQSRGRPPRLLVGGLWY